MNSPKQNSQVSKPVPAPEKVEEVVKVEEVDDYVDDVDNVDDELVIPETIRSNPILKKVPKVEEVEEVEETPDKSEDVEQQILMEIEMLQNNGRFRVELLHQLQEINKALVVVAGTLVDISKKNDKE